MEMKEIRTIVTSIIFHILCMMGFLFVLVIFTTKPTGRQRKKKKVNQDKDKDNQKMKR